MAITVGLCAGSGGVWPMEGRSALANNNCWSGVDIANMTGRDIYTWNAGVGGGAGPWATLIDAYAANPSTTRIWWNIQFLKADCGISCLTPADRDALVAVSDEIRTRTAAGIDIVVSAGPTFDPISTCFITNGRAYQKQVNAAAWVLANASAVHAGKNYADTVGPVLTPITPDTNNGNSDPCHPGVGQTPGFKTGSDHPQIVRDFFGDA